MPVEKKIIKNDLNTTVRRYIKDGLSYVESVDRFLKEIIALDRQMLDKLVFVFKEKYKELFTRGETGNDIFYEMLKYITGSRSKSNFNKETYHAGLALLVYFFEKCDVFEK